MTDKHRKMIEFWTERSLEYSDDPRANTNDIHLRKLEIGYVAQRIENHRPATVLDFGCANGYTTLQLASLYPDIRFLGIDINTPMIAAAQKAAKLHDVQNVYFAVTNVLTDGFDRDFDFIYAIRTFQNIDPENQKRIIEILIRSLGECGVLMYIESYAEEYARLNQDRATLDLEPLPIHEHLTLLTPEFDEHVQKYLKLICREAPTSSYYLITRLIYSAFARERQEPIDYDHLLHRLAAVVPQIGAYGPQRACVYLKPATHA